jgi:hypothetical protein
VTVGYRETNDWSVGIVKAVKNASHCLAEGGIQEEPSIEAEQVRARVLVRDARTVELNAIASLIVFEIVLQAVQHAAKIFGCASIAERDQLEQGVER